MQDIQPIPTEKSKTIGSTMSRREPRGARKKLAEGHGSQEEPYNISDEDETETVQQQQEREQAEDERLDRILREAGIDPTGTPKGEKQQLVQILEESSEAVRHKEAAHTVKVTRGKTRQQQPAAETELPKVNKPPVKVNKSPVKVNKSPISKATTKAGAKKKTKPDSDSDLDSETQYSDARSSSAASTPSKNTRRQTASSASEHDKDDFELVTNIKVTPRGNKLGMRLGKKLKVKEDSPEDKRKTKGKRQTKLQKPMEDAIDIVSSDSDEEEVPTASHSPEYGLQQDSRVKRAVKRPVTSATKEDRPKRQRKSPGDNQSKPVYRKIDLNTCSEDEEAATKKVAPKAKSKNAGKADKKPFYANISYDETSDETEGRNPRHVAQSPRKMEVEVKVKLRISPKDAKVKAAEGSSTADESVSGEVESEGHSQEEVVGQGQGSKGQTPVKVTENTEPFSGVSVSPDLFGSQQQAVEDNEAQGMEVSDNDVLNLEPTDDETQAMDVGAGTADDDATEDEAAVDAGVDAAPVDDDETQEMMDGPDGPVPVPTATRPDVPVPSPTRPDGPVPKATYKIILVHTLPVQPTPAARPKEELFDIWVEDVKKRAARDKAALGLANKSTRTKDAAMEGEECGEDTPCPYCTRTPPADFTDYTPMVKKIKLQQNRVDPEPHFAPPGVSPADHAKTILAYVSSYHARLREAQSQTHVKVDWERAVQVGRHCTGTLFEKVRGRPERHCDFNLLENDDDDLPDLKVETIQRTAMEAISAHGPVRSTRKRPAERDWLPDEQNDDDDDDDFLSIPKTSRGTRKNRGETAKGRGRGRGTRRNQMENNTVSDYFTNTNTKPIKRKVPAEKATRTVVAMETQQFDVLDIEEGSNDSTLPPGQGAGQGAGQQHEVLSVPSDTSNSRASSTETTKSNLNGRTTTPQHDSRSNSPLPFKLTAEGTMAYDDDDILDDEVGNINNINRMELDETTGELVCKQPQTSPTPSDKDADVSDGENSKDDILLFEDLKSVIEPVKLGTRKRPAYKVTKPVKHPVTTEDVVINRRGTRTRRGKSPDPDEDDVIPGTQQEDVGGNDVPGAALRNAAQGTQGRMVGSAEARRPLRDRIGDRVTVPLGQTTQTRTAPRQVIRPQIVELQPEEEKVDCPLCSRPYGKSLIEAHAANCQGNPSPEGAGGDPGHPAEPVQPRRGGPTRQAAPAFAQGGAHEVRDSDEEVDFITLTGREAAPTTRGADRLKDYHIPKLPHATPAPPKKDVPMGNCPICDRPWPLATLAVHADACATRMEAGEAVQEPPPRRTRTTAPVYQPPHRQQAGNNVQQPRARGAAEYDLPNSDDDFTGSMTGVRRLRTQQPHIQGFMDNKTSGVHRPRVLPTSAASIPTLSCPGTSPPSTRTPNFRTPPTTNLRPPPTTSTQRAATASPTVPGGSDSGSGSGESEEGSSVTSSSDADDDVPLRTVLNVPREARQPRVALTARRQGPARVTNSPIRTFQPISAIQGENLIDFRNQFRTATQAAASAPGGRGGGRGRGGKRKRTGGKRKSRKKRKVTTKGASSKAAKTAPPKTLKDAW